MPLFASLSASLLSGLVVGYAATAAVELATQARHKVSVVDDDDSNTAPTTHDKHTQTHTAGRSSSSGSSTVVVIAAPPQQQQDALPYDIVLPPRATQQAHDKSTATATGAAPAAAVQAGDEDGDVSALWSRFARQCREAAVHGLPSSEHVRCYGSYVAGLNYERRIPSWVLERIDRTRAPRRSRRSSSASSDSGSGSDMNTSTASHNNDGSSSGGSADAYTASTPPQQQPAVSRRRSSFYADATVPEAFRVQPGDYATRGLSRGHLAAAQLHTTTQDDLDATFNMNANIVPQDMTVNALDWARLERLTRRLSQELSGLASSSATTTSSGSGKSNKSTPRGRLYVVSGPAFLPRWVCPSPRRGDGGTDLQVDVPATSHMARLVMQHELTGPATHTPRANDAHIAVPTHLYKVLLAEYGDVDDTATTQQQQTTTTASSATTTSRYAIAAFLMPNTPIAEERPLTAYQVPLSRIEQVTGLHFFPRLARSSMADLCATHTCDVPSPEYVKDYRHVALLRRATSIAELNRAYATIRNNATAGGAAISKRVMHEHERRREELAAMAVRPLEEV